MEPIPSLIEIAIEAKSPADGKKLGEALAKLAAEDAGFRVAIDEHSGQALLGAVSEDKLDANIDALRRACAFEIDVGAPQVAYRETLTKRVEIAYTYRKPRSAKNDFAQVKIVFEPAEPGAGSSFESKIVGGAVPNEYIPGVEKGVKSVMSSGILAGFPVVDVKATLIDGAFHDVDSSPIAFEIAARAAFRESLEKGGAVLLEPMMNIEVVIPVEHAGPVLDDLRARRGQALRRDARENEIVVTALAPLANMLGYAQGLRARTKGRGAFAMQFSHYAPVDWPHGDGPFRPAVGMRA